MSSNIAPVMSEGDRLGRRGGWTVMQLPLRPRPSRCGLWTWVAFQNSIEMRLEALYPPLHHTVIGWEPLLERLQTNTLAFVVLVF